MSEKIVLLDGYLSVTNSELIIEKQRGKSSSLKKDTSWLSVLALAITFGIFKYNESFTLASTIKDRIMFGLGLVGLAIVLTLIFYLIFRKNWSNKIQINEITKIKFDKSDPFEIEVKIINLNHREKEISFRKLEHQFELFVDTITKRNARIIMEEIK